jgi:hypothetical protein
MLACARDRDGPPAGAGHSHSIVPGGLVVRSIAQPATPVKREQTLPQLGDASPAAARRESPSSRARSARDARSRAPRRDRRSSSAPAPWGTARSRRRGRGGAAVHDERVGLAQQVEPRRGRHVAARGTNRSGSLRPATRGLDLVEVGAVLSPVEQSSRTPRPGPGTGGARAARADAERSPELAHLDLVEVGERLDDAPGRDHLLDHRHAVVVRLDGVGALRAAGLDGVGVDGALAQQVRLDAEPPRLALEDGDEGVADDPALASGSTTPASAARKSSLASTKSRWRPRPSSRSAASTRGSRPCASGRCRCAAGARARPEGQAEQPPPRSSRRRRRRAGRPTGRRPARAAARPAPRGSAPSSRWAGSRRSEHEVGDHLVAVRRRVVDLGVELEAVAAQRVGADGGEAVLRLRRRRARVAELLEAGAHGAVTES